MTNTTPITGKWKVGPWTAEGTVGFDDRGEITFLVEWDKVPSKPLTPKQKAQYQKGRNDFLQRAADKFDCIFKVVDL